MTAPTLDTNGSNLSDAVPPLKATAPWVKLIAVLNFLAVGLMLLVAVGLVAGMGSQAMGEAAGGGAMMRMAGIVYLFMAGVYFIPALLSWRYAVAIDRFAATVSVTQLSDALNAQRRVWKFWGIIIVVSLVFGGLAMGAGIIAAIATMGSRG